MAPEEKEQMPATLRRSPEKAQRTFLEVRRKAEEEYGPGERAMRTAYAALKHSFEKVGDHWEAKARPGPSDPRAQRKVAEGGEQGESFGGVAVAGHSRRELLERARELGIEGRSRMDKEALARAIARRQG